MCFMWLLHLKLLGETSRVVVILVTATERQWCTMGTRVEGTTISILVLSEFVNSAAILLISIIIVASAAAAVAAG